MVPPEKLQDFSQVLMQNLVRMAHEVTPEEVEKAKTQLKVRTTDGRFSLVQGRETFAFDTGSS